MPHKQRLNWWRCIFCCRSSLSRRRVSIAFEVGDDVVTILGVFYGGQKFEFALGE